MSDQTQADLLQDRDDDTPQIRQVRDALRRQHAANAEQTKLLEAAAPLAKENAFLKAGFDVTSPMGEFFFKNYDGDLDKDAITARAAELGVTGVAPSEPASAPEPPAEAIDPAQTAARNALANDTGNASSVPPGDVAVDSYREFYAGLAAGKSREDAAVPVLSNFVAAANEGDPRFRFDPQAWTNSEEARSR